jgi:hypothetical protein
MAFDKVVDSATLDSDLTQIADKIREKTGGGDAVAFPGGFVGGIDDVFDAGAQSEYDRFWDRMQHYGERTSYYQAFCVSTFPLDEFKPKYDMYVTNAGYMFAYWNTSRKEGYDIWKWLDLRQESIGVVLDFSAATSFQSCFQGNYQLVAVGTFDTRNATALSSTFYYAQNLHTIEKLILKDDGSQTFSNPFLVCNALENIVVEGKIGNAVSFTNSTKLTHDSLMSIIGALLDISGTGTTKTLTLGTTNLKKLTDAEKKIATDKGWTLA